jgi:hypothetical protein
VAGETSEVDEGEWETAEGEGAGFSATLGGDGVAARLWARLEGRREPVSLLSGCQLARGGNAPLPLRGRRKAKSEEKRFERSGMVGWRTSGMVSTKAERGRSRGALRPAKGKQEGGGREQGVTGTERPKTSPLE